MIIDAVNKTARKANVDKWPDQYVMVFETSSKGDLVFFERTKRTWDEVDVCSVNTNTMEVKEIIHEVDKPYRDPHARNVVILMMEKISCSVRNVPDGGIIIIMTEMEI